MAKMKEPPTDADAFKEYAFEIGPEKLSSAIRFHRKKSGLSQLALSKLAGVGKTAVFDLEKGKQTIQLDTLLKVLHVLNIHVSFQSPMTDYKETK